MSSLFRRSVLFAAGLLCPVSALVDPTASPGPSPTPSPTDHPVAAAAATPHGWDTLSDGFPGRIVVVLVVMAVTVSIFLVIAALGPKKGFYDYRPTETMDKFPVNLDLDEEEEDEADVLFDAGRHKLLRKSGPVV